MYENHRTARALNHKRNDTNSEDCDDDESSKTTRVFNQNPQRPHANILISKFKIKKWSGSHGDMTVTQAKFLVG